MNKKINEIGKMTDALKEEFHDVSFAQNKKLIKVETIFKNIAHISNHHREYMQYLQEHIEAITFISWFKWAYIKSDKLRNEAYEKLINDVTYTQHSPTIGSELSESDVEIFDEGLVKANNNISAVYASADYSFAPISNYKVFGRDVCVDDDGFFKLKETPKHEPTEEEKVCGLVANPWKYSKTDLYNAYRYLKSVLEKDALVDTYYNKTEAQN